MVIQLWIKCVIQPTGTANYSVKIGWELVEAQPVVPKCADQKKVHGEPNPTL